MNNPAKVVLAGGGIGGLTTAIALRRAGFEVSVFERAAELGEVGAGLLLAANAQKALAKLGLADAVSSLGTPASAGEIRSWRGKVLASIPAAELEKKIGTPSAAVHRADLQALLAQEVGEGTLRLGAEVVAFEQDESGVRVLLCRWRPRECRRPGRRGRSALSDQERAVRFRGAPLRRLHGLAGGRGAERGATAVGDGLRVVGEGRQVRVRPHRRREGLLVRDRQRPGGREGRPAR